MHYIHTDSSCVPYSLVYLSIISFSSIIFPSFDFLWTFSLDLLCTTFLALRRYYHRFFLLDMYLLIYFLVISLLLLCSLKIWILAMWLFAFSNFIFLCSCTFPYLFFLITSATTVEYESKLGTHLCFMLISVSNAHDYLVSWDSNARNYFILVILPMWVGIYSYSWGSWKSASNRSR